MFWSLATSRTGIPALNILPIVNSQLLLFATDVVLIRVNPAAHG